MEALKVPPMLVAAWIREYTGGLKLVLISTTSSPGNSSNTLGATRGSVSSGFVWGSAGCSGNSLLRKVPGREVGIARGWKLHVFIALRR